MTQISRISSWETNRDLLGRSVAYWVDALNDAGVDNNYSGNVAGFLVGTGEYIVNLKVRLSLPRTFVHIDAANNTENWVVQSSGSRADSPGTSPRLSGSPASVHRWWNDHARCAVTVGKRKDGDSSDSVTAERSDKGRFPANTAALLLLAR
ncbi:hypothetical protein V501_04465 [Pseudogymnoascus sp. VKM F-4519 (FW-2642)]|nr:hypothetical protein V501_04465 [Pseudogymnoascus sp. VKM F-4519 (FW-2642)]